MNRIYRTLWSIATQSWQAVPETAKTAGKKSKSSAGGVVASVALGFTLHGVAHAQAPPAINQLPTGVTVVRGSATISQTVTAQAAAMMVNQSSQRAAINWNTFNLGSAASINFVQPNAQAVTLNRVNDSNPSQIFGRITANGQVFLTNANGVYFSPTASVDVGAITATTHSISDDNFMSGKDVFERNGATGKVVNEGRISSALGGYVALLASEVQNAGVVVARAGTVVMATGDTITLSIDGAGSLAGITTTPSTIATLVENKQAVLAPDGQIILSAVALNKLQAGVIKNSGSLEANSLVNKGGKIVLEGDDITLDRNSKIEAKGPQGGGIVLVGGDWQGSGDLRQATKVTMEAGATIDASATDQGDGGKVVLWSDVHNADSVTRVNGSIKAEAGPNGGDGGRIETSGHQLDVEGVSISTQSQNSATGEWLLDPWDITIASSGATGTSWSPTGTTTKTYTSLASSTILDTDITGALSASNVVVSTGGASGDGNGSGNITVSSDLSWSSAKTLTFTALGSVNGTGNISMTGATGAGLIFNQVGNSTYSGNISGTNATVTKQGAGTLSLSGNNSYGGGTTLTAGVLNLGSANAIGSIGTISFGGGTLQSSASNTADYSAHFGSASQTYKIDTNGYDITWASVLGGGTLTKLGAGTLTLTGNDTSITGITLSGGNLQVGFGGTTGALSSITVTTSANTELIFNRSDAVTYASLTVTGSGGITQAGTGTLNFTSSSKSYSGRTYVKAGTLDIGMWSSTAATQLVVDSGATFKYANNGSARQFAFSSLSGAGTVYTITGGVPLRIGSDNTSTEFSGNFLGNGTSSGPLIFKQGTGTLTFSGTAGGDFQGFTLNEGVVQIGKGGTEGAVGTGLTFGGGTLAINRSDTVTLPSFYGSGTLRQMGAGTTVVARASGGFTGTTELLAGTLLLAPSTSGNALYNSSTSGTFIFGGGVLEFSATDKTDYSSHFSTANNQNYKIDTNGQTVTFATALTSVGGSLNKLDSAPTPGTLILTGANTYSGTTTISAGTLQIGNNGVTGSLAGSITNNSALAISRSDAVTFSNAIDGAGSLTKLGTGAIKLSGDNSNFTGPVTLSAGTLGLGSSNALGSITSTTSNAITFSGGALQYSANNTLDYSSRFDNTTSNQSYKIDTNSQSISLGASFGSIGSSFTKLGSGTLTLTGSNTLSGGITLTAGSLNLGSSNAIDSSGTISFGGGTLQYSATNTTDYSSRFSVAASQAYKIDTDGQTVTFDTALTSSSGTLTKLGLGTLKLRAANTYTGTTTVSAGTLQVGDSTNTVAKLGTGAITTNSDLIFYRSGANTLSAMAPITLGTAIGGAGNVTVMSTGTLNIDRDINLTGANSTIKILAGSDSAANTSLVSDLTLSKLLTTTTTGTIAIFAGSPTAAASNGATSVLNGKMTGATGAVDYKIYNASSASLSNAVAGTRSFYYRVSPSITVNNVLIANKTYDGTTIASVSGGSIVGLTADEPTTPALSLAFTSANFADANAGSNKAVTLGGLSLVNSAWNITGLNATVSGSSGTITKANLTLSGTKVYDGTTVVSGTQLLATGVHNESFAVTGSGATGNLSSADVQASSTSLASITGLTLGTSNGTNTGLASNYNNLSTTGSSFSVSRATATLTATKTYDGDASLSGSQLAITGVTVGGVTQTLGYSGVASLFDPNVVTPNNYVMGTNLALTNGTGSANNYVLPVYSYSAKNSATVGAKSITVSLTAPSSAYTYDAVSTYANIASAVTGFTNTAMVGSDNIASVTNSNTPAGVAQAGNFIITPTSVTMGTGLASNYSFSYAPLTVAIARAALTVTGTSVANKTYDRTTTATLSGGLLSGVLGTDTVVLTEAGTFASANVGTGIAVTANYSIDNTNANNYTITQPTGLSANITAKALTVSGASAANKTYDGNNTVTLSGSLVGVISGDTVTLSQAGTFALVNAGTGIAVIASDSLGGASASNYTLTQPTGLTADINKANATITASSGSGTYNGSLQSVSGFTVSGLVNNETASVLSGVTASASGTNAGTYASVASGTATNYNLTFVNGALTINKANATVTASSGTTTYSGVAQSVSGFTATGLVNNETEAVLSGVTAIGTGTNAGTYASVASGTDTNYNLTFVNGALTINKANATVTANSGTRTYSGVAQSVNGFTATGLVNNETTSVLSGVTASGSGINAGTYTSTANGTDSNYNLTFVNGALTINKANATVTANSSTTTYSGVAQSVNGFTATGLVNNETTSVLSGVTASGSGTNAGTYSSTATGTDSNYNLTFVNGALTINKAHLTVTANNATKTYGDTNPSLSTTVTGFVNSETLATSGVTGSGAASTTATALTGAGTASITAGVGTLVANNYDFTTVNNGTLTINKANATVTASSGTTTYSGLSQSVNGFTATGLVNSETASVLSGVTAGATGTNAGTYTSTASGSDSNYNLTFVNGAFTINKAPLSVVLSSQTKVYDGTSNATIANGSYTLTGFVSGEGGTVAHTQGSYNSANVVSASTITASLVAGDFTANNGTLLSNYVLPTSASGTGSITPARLSVTGTKTYDGLNSFDATALSVAGVNGETFNASGTGTMASKNVQTNLALVSTSGISLNGNNGALTSNYTALTTNDTQVSVTPRAINMSAPSANKTYDGTTLYEASSNDLTALSAQLVGGDRVAAAEVVFGNKDAGTGKRVTLNTVTISDDNGGNNYTVGKLDVLTGVINKAPLTVSVVNDARFIGQSDSANFAGVVYTGLVGGETAAVLSAGAITRSNASVVSAGQYNGVLQASGWQSNNYAISYNAGNYTIVGAHTLLVRVPTASTIYGTTASYAPTVQYLDVSNNTIMTLNPVMTGNALSVNDGVGGQASFTLTAANATLSSSGHVQAGGYNLEASSVTKTGSNFQNLLVTGGLTVTPKILNNNLGVQSITKVYDGSASISNFGLNFDQPLAGVTTGDAVSLVGSGSFDDRHVGTGKTVNLSLGLRGADATNYALTNANLSTNVGEITQLASVTYTGAANGVWSDASNWAGGALPDRNNVAQVVVPTGKTVVYNTDQVGMIGSTLSVDGAMRFASSNAFTLTNTVSGAGDLQQRGNGMLTVSGTNTNFSGNLDIGAYAAELGNAQALGTGHVVSNTGHLSVASGLTLPSLRIDGAATLDTAVKTTGDQVYNGALTFLSSGTTQAPNFVSDAGDIDFLSTVSAGTGAMSAQRALVVSAPNGSVMMNDQVGRSVRGLDLLTYLASGLQDTSPYALSIKAPTIKLNGDVTTFESQTYDGAVRVGSNTNNGHTRLLVSVDPSITFKGNVDDSDPTGKVNSLDVRAISLAALVSNAPVPTITFENDVGSISPLASLRVAAGIQSTAPSAVVTDIQTDDASRRDPHYKGDIVLKGNMTTDSAPFLIAEQLVTDLNVSPSITWSTGQPDFKLRLPTQGSSSVLPSNVHLMAPGSNTGNGNGGGNSGSANNATINRNDEPASEAAKLWLMAHASDKHIDRKMSDEVPDKTMPPIEGQMVADVKVGNEADASAGAFIQVREFGPTVLRPMQPFIYKLPDDTFVHSDGKAQIKLSATLSNGDALPSWLKFSATESRFSGTPPKELTSIEVVVSATDHLGRSASTRVRLVFANDARA